MSSFSTDNWSRLPLFPFLLQYRVDGVDGDPVALFAQQVQNLHSLAQSAFPNVSFPTLDFSNVASVIRFHAELRELLTSHSTLVSTWRDVNDPGRPTTDFDLQILLEEAAANAVVKQRKRKASTELASGRNRLCPADSQSSGPEDDATGTSPTTENRRNRYLARRWYSEELRGTADRSVAELRSVAMASIADKYGAAYAVGLQNACSERYFERFVRFRLDGTCVTDISGPNPTLLDVIQSVQLIRDCVAAMFGSIDGFQVLQDRLFMLQGDAIRSEQLSGSEALQLSLSWPPQWGARVSTPGDGTSRIPSRHSGGHRADTADASARDLFPPPQEAVHGNVIS